MQYKLIGLAPLFAVVASVAFAAGPDDSHQTPLQEKSTDHCDRSGAQDLVFGAACGPVQRSVRVAAKSAEPKARLPAPQVKRITRMPWQTGIFQ